MDYAQSFAISAAGMAMERTRVDVAALNLANANTMQTPDGVSYRPLRVLTRSMPISTVTPAFATQVDNGINSAQLSFPQTNIEPSGAAPRNVYEPGNPLANAKGFVIYPGVDPAAEMVNMMDAQRAYEANVAAMNVTRALALKTLDIGG